MIFSPAKKEDLKRRVAALEAAENALMAWRGTDTFMKPYYLERAKEYGNDAKSLKERIASHDYSEEDKVILESRRLLEEARRNPIKIADLLDEVWTFMKT